MKFDPVSGRYLTSAKTSYKSIKGEIVTDWRIINDKFLLNVKVPVNTTANIFIPVGRHNKIFESNKSLSEVKEINIIKTEKEFTEIKIQSGSYNFISEL